MEWEYVTDGLALLSVFVGILGDTHDRTVTGLRGVRPLGVAVLVIGSASLTFSCLKARSTSIAASTLSGQVTDLQTKLGITSQDLTLARNEIGITHQTINEMKLQSTFQLGRISALRGVVDDGNAASLKIRNEQQEENAKLMRVALSNTLCFLNPACHKFPFARNMASPLNFAEEDFIKFLQKLDLNAPGDKTDYLFTNGSAGIPLYKTMSTIAKFTGDRFDQQMSVSAPYLPPEINRALDDYRFQARGYIYKEGYETLHKFSVEYEMKNVLLMDEDDAKVFWATLSKAASVDRQLSNLTDQRTKFIPPFDCRF